MRGVEKGRIADGSCVLRPRAGAAAGGQEPRGPQRYGGPGLRGDHARGRVCFLAIGLILRARLCGRTAHPVLLGSPRALVLSVYVRSSALRGTVVQVGRMGLLPWS